MNWTCPICGTENDIRLESCSVCSSPRQRPLSTKVLDSEKEDLTRPTPERTDSDIQSTDLMRIKCPSCGTPMLPGLPECPSCHEPIPLDQPSQIPTMTSEPVPGHVKIKVQTPEPGPDLHEPDAEPIVHPTDQRLLSYETMDLEDTRLLKKKKPSTEGIPAEPAPAQIPPSSVSMKPESPPPQPTTPSIPMGTASIKSGAIPPPMVPETHAPGNPVKMLTLWFGLFITAAFLSWLFLSPLFRKGYWLIPHRGTLTSQTPVNTPTESPHPNETSPPDALVPETEWSFIDIPAPLYTLVYIDGVWAGSTPLLNYPLSPGSHRVEIRWPDRVPMNPGERSQLFTIILKPGEVKSLDFSVNLYGSLYLNSWPWSFVKLDGKNVGDTPRVITRLPIGSHSVTFQTQDGQTFETTVEIRNNEIARVSHRFSGEPAPK